MGRKEHPGGLSHAPGACRKSSLLIGDCVGSFLHAGFRVCSIQCSVRPSGLPASEKSHSHQGDDHNVLLLSECLANDT
jgi:hypothetical protein